MFLILGAHFTRFNATNLTATDVAAPHFNGQAGLQIAAYNGALEANDRSMIDISLNSACSRDIRIVGDEKTPVIVIDDPILSTDELVQYASQSASFSSDGEFLYPGVRADLPAEYARGLGPDLIALISHVYNTPRSYKPHLIHQLFSLVAEKPENLEVLQRVPHFDNRSPYYFATVHYLGLGDHGGTGLFRHRPTRYERITDERYEAYVQAAQSHMEANGPPAEKYIDGSDDHYELIGEVEYRPNRLVIYPSNLLHSGLIKPDRDIDKDPVSGRLTANLFLFFTDLVRRP